MSRSVGVLVNGIVSRGRLRVGDVVVCGRDWCKVKFLYNDVGEKVDYVTPGVPVAIGGFTNIQLLTEFVVSVESETVVSNQTQNQWQLVLLE